MSNDEQQGMVVSGRTLHGWLSDLARFASTDTALPALNTIRLSPATVHDGRPAIVGEATDRYTVAESWLETSPGRKLTHPALHTTVMLPTAQLKQAMALAKSARTNDILLEQHEDNTITVDGLDGQRVTIQPFTDGPFPRTGSLWTSVGESERTAFRVDGRKLERIAAVAKRREQPMLVHTGAHGKKPLHVTVGESFRALVMPMDMQQEQYTAPRAVPPVAAAA